MEILFSLDLLIDVNTFVLQGTIGSRGCLTTLAKVHFGQRNLNLFDEYKAALLALN